MRVFGLTGGIGTGKSTVAKLLAARGAAVVDADQLAREVVAPGSEGLAAIVAAFGPGVLDAAGALDRTRLGELVFADAAKRKLLEGITHPRIVMRMAEQIGVAAAAGTQVVVVDVPLLYESGAMQGAVEKVIVVYAPRAVQAARVLARDALPPAQVEARLAAQLDIEEKRRRADYVIDNGGALTATEAQIDALWPQLL